ncbi:hypothetical protein [Micromonospora purpureochromogenes]|uniref:SurA N-terminal domain-containing protein n=1 Tax=Micromonospora purpureochromogenes TaxID=47872 RepID=A0ABX2RP69_9ACTN|nr:hypothetical protein [Micromonospora purpureochromogenes]NYF56936.1 hypothetical protein [Micromonospora purpureochromogenes]
MRARRLIAAASVAALGVLSLAACGKSSPDVAAYVGDRTYSVDRVDAIYDDAQAKFAEAVRQSATQAGVTPQAEQLRSRVTRQDVVNLLVSIDLGKRVVAEQGLQVPDQVTPEQLAQQLQMPPQAEFAKLWGEWADISMVLSQKLPPAELSDASVMAVYHAIEETGGIQSGLSVGEVRQLFGEGGFVRTASALSTALEEQADKVDLSVNPRFRPLGVPSWVNKGQELVFYALPYVDASGPVTDISTPEPVATPAEQAGSVAP